MKQKLQATSIPDLDFEDLEGNVFKFSDFYDYHKFLGSGSFGFVVSAIDRESGEHLALKIVDATNESSTQCLKKEAEILRNLPEHGNVIQFKHIKEFVNYMVLAIENVKGGTLGDLIKRRTTENQPMREEECAKAIKGILLGLKHIHAQDYIHRDLKPSNVVIENPSNLLSVKIVDFGLATKMQTGRIGGIDETCGTLVYQAPEQMLGETTYGKSVDLWAVGFIMYELICGTHPLYVRGEDKQSYKEKLKNFKQLSFSKGTFSNLAQNLLEKLCNFKPSGRYKLDQALTHPWITRNLDGQIPRTAFEENIFRYEIDNKLRKVVNMSLFLSVVKNYRHIQESNYRALQEKLDQEKQLKLEREQEEQKLKEEQAKSSTQALTIHQTPYFSHLKGETSMPNTATSDLLDEDERFLQEIFAMQYKKASYDVKEVAQNNEENYQDNFNDKSQQEIVQNQSYSVLESGEQSSKSSRSYASTTFKDTEKIITRSKEYNMQQITTGGKPPLGVRDGSSNNNTTDQGQRTQKSFRIHKLGKRGSQLTVQNNATALQNQNTQFTRKLLGQQRFSPLKRRNEHSENDILAGIDEADEGVTIGGVLSEQKQQRQISANRIEEEKSVRVFKTRRNSSASLRKTQQQQQNQYSGSRHQSDMDSEDHSITPNQKDNGGDFSQALGKAQLKYKKAGKKQKHKAKSMVRKKVVQMPQPYKDNLTNQKLVQGQIDQSKSKNIQLQQFNSNSNTNVSTITLSFNSLQKVTLKLDQPLSEKQSIISQDITLQIPPQPNSQIPKRNNTSARNNPIGQRKIVPSETFDIIRHGPSLKEKSSEGSFLSSPQRGSEVNLNNQKSIQALLNLQQCASDEQVPSDAQMNPMNQTMNKRLPLPLSPFEQFLQSLMKQNQQEPANSNGSTLNQQQQKKQTQHPFSLMLSSDLQQPGAGAKNRQQHESLARKTQMPSQYKLVLDKKDELGFAAKPQVNKVLGPPAKDVQQTQQSQQQIQQQISNISSFIKGKEQMMVMYQRTSNN